MKTYKVKQKGKNIYLYFFLFSCLLFWWLPSILYRVFSYGEDPVHSFTLMISLGAVLAFILGYKIFINYKIVFFKINENTINRVSVLAKYLSIYSAFPSLFFAIVFFIYRSSVAYGSGEGLPFLYQTFFYAQMTFFFLYITTTDDIKYHKKTFYFIVLLSISIRLIVSLHWGRFFVGQIIFAYFLVAIARGWLVLNKKNLIKLAFWGLVIFIVPAITRGSLSTSNSLMNQRTIINFIARGSTLKLFQDNLNIDLHHWCNPLLVSLTAQTVPYHLMNMCTINIWGQHGLPATLDRILALKELGPNAMYSLDGPGSNYLLELYVSAGKIFGVIVGSFFLGAFAAFSFISLSKKTLFGLLWIEFLTRAIFAPRSNLGYAFERFPSLLLLIFLVSLISYFVFRNRYAKA